MLLFLDFDGVLHPKGGGLRRFTRLQFFEEVMREPGMSNIPIVITSTWRTAYSLEKLRSFFSADIALRLVGTTASLRQYQTEFERGEEVEAYVTKNKIDRWVALDDDLQGFARALRNRVVFCDGDLGITDVDAKKLRALV